MFENRENFGREQDSAEDRQVGKFLARLRLFDHVVHEKFGVRALDGRGFHRAVFRELFARHFLDTDGSSAVGLIGVHQLAGDGLLAEDDVVAVQHGKRLVADEILRAQDGVSEPARLFLPQKIDVGKIACRVQGIAVGVASLLCKGGVVFGRVVEKFLHRGLVAPRDDEHVGDAAVGSFLDQVIDGGIVHDGEHFLGDGTGDRQHARAETCRGDDRFCNLLHSFLRLGLAPVGKRTQDTLTSSIIVQVCEKSNVFAAFPLI